MISRSLPAAVLAFSLYSLSANASDCDDISCQQDTPSNEECFDQSCDLPPENEAPACDGQECPPIDDCQDPQSCEGPGDGPGETPNYAVNVDSDSTVTILSTDITSDGEIYVVVSPTKGTASDNQGASVTFDTNDDFSNLEEGATEEVTFEVYTNGSDVTYAIITVTVTGVVEEEPQTEEPVDQAPVDEVSLNAGVISHDTLSRNGELNDGEFVTVWMDTQRLAQGEALVIRNIPDHLEYIETLSTDLPADTSSTIAFRTEILGSFYREEDRILRISPRSGDETSTPAVHVVFKVNASERDEATALLIERLDSEGLEATTATVEIPPAQSAMYYLEVARSNSGATLTAWPPATQEEDFVTLEATVSAETGSLTCSDSETLSENGLLNGNGTATASCSDEVITASNIDASVSAEAPLTLPLMFTSEESTNLIAAGSMTFSDASSIILEAAAQATEGSGVEPILILENPYGPYAALRLALPDSVEKATNLTVDLLLDPDSSEIYPAEFDCKQIPTSSTLNEESLVVTCTPDHVHIAFPVDMAVENQADFEDGLARVDVDFDTTNKDGSANASVLTITKYDEIDSAVAYHADYTISFEEEKDSLGIFAALLALISFGLYRRRKQVS